MKRGNVVPLRADVVRGDVGEETNERLLYLVAVSRKLADPPSSVVLGQSGAGKSGITEVIERLVPAGDVVRLTRLRLMPINRDLSAFVKWARRRTQR